MDARREHGRNEGAAEPSLAALGYRWPEEGLARIPDWVYTSEEVYAREVERIFHGLCWNYVALEAEIPAPGDFKRSFVGPTPVVAARGADGAVHVFENRCAHRGAQFCRPYRGMGTEFVCPYHQWTYGLDGRLIGVPFRRGVKGEGGMPASFRLEDHGARRLKVAARRGVVFASFAAEIEPLEDYLGPEILADFDATFDGRGLTILGYYRNTVPANWKMYHDNLKDPYHATLLHSYLVTFGLMVAGNKSAMIADAKGRHGTMASAKPDKLEVAPEHAREMRAFHDNLALADPRLLDYVREFQSPWSVTMQTIWPNMVVQRELNTLGTRQIVPQGPNEFMMIWTMFGYEGDSDAMTRHRLRQGNLMGPAGFLGLEDNEAMKFVQDGLRKSRAASAVVELGGTEEGTSTGLITEAAIRALYRHWREVMDA
jgi:apoptosis-inducing factor 3